MENSKEIWKDVVGYEEWYQVSSHGNIISLKRSYVKCDKLMKKIPKSSGSLYVVLRKNGKRKNLSIHRLVALNFIPNPNNYLIVNHINGIKTDNRVENLEWCTSSYNNQHALDMGLRKPKTDEVLNLENGIFYDSVLEAIKSTNLTRDQFHYRYKKSSFKYQKVEKLLSKTNFC